MGPRDILLTPKFGEGSPTLPWMPEGSKIEGDAAGCRCNSIAWLAPVPGAAATDYRNGQKLRPARAWRSPAYFHRQGGSHQPSRASPETVCAPC